MSPTVFRCRPLLFDEELIGRCETLAGDQVMPDSLTGQRNESVLCVLHHGRVQPSYGHSAVEALDLAFDDEVCQLHQQVISGAIGKPLQLQLGLLHKAVGFA